MDKLSLQNPVFATYVIAATLMILKAVSMSWLTVVRMMQVNGGFRSPEDLKKTPFNPKPDPKQLEPDERVRLVGAGRQHHDRHTRRSPHGSRHLESVELRQPEVEHDEIGPARSERVERGLAVAGGEHGVTGGTKVVAAQHDDLGLVVDDEDGLHCANRSLR